MSQKWLKKKCLTNAFGTAFVVALTIHGFNRILVQWSDFPTPRHQWRDFHVGVLPSGFIDGMGSSSLMRFVLHQPFINSMLTMWRKFKDLMGNTEIMTDNEFSFCIDWKYLLCTYKPCSSVVRSPVLAFNQEHWQDAWALLQPQVFESDSLGKLALTAFPRATRHTHKDPQSTKGSGGWAMWGKGFQSSYLVSAWSLDCL